MMPNPENLTQHLPAARSRGVRKPVALLILVLFQGLAVKAAEEPSVKDYVRQLEASYKGVQSLQADFTQKYQWGSRSRTESGVVYFARGGRMRWEYRSPEDKLFVSDGKQVLLYVPEEKQLTRTNVKSSEDVRVPFRLLLSRLDLGKVFKHIEFAPKAIESLPGDRVLRAIPKRGDDSGIHEVFLEITPAYDIRTLVLVYTDRGKMTFTFQDVRRNAAVSPALFEFRPPPGTEIINQK
jgi:outer membrane lipoprotein carrier protein